MRAETACAKGGNRTPTSFTSQEPESSATEQIAPFPEENARSAGHGEAQNGAARANTGGTSQNSGGSTSLPSLRLVEGDASSAILGSATPTRAPVAALYVMPDGHYPELVADWWDEARDARLYEGPWPVVAHPPCGPWGRLRFLCTKQDPSCGPRAVEQVRRWGGVLEHPADSLLWRHCGMPRPGELPDAWSGRSWSVRQVAWGHSCEKPTWLYTVGVDPYQLRSGLRTDGVPTECIATGPGRPTQKHCTKRRRSLSPLSFAQWLVELAATAVRP